MRRVFTREQEIPWFKLGIFLYKKQVFARDLAYGFCLAAFFVSFVLMKPASIPEIKKELAALSPAELSILCLRLARYKKENKELLHYLLFLSQDQESYISGIKEEIAEAFSTINGTSYYYAMKNIRKILRLTDRYIRFAANPQTELELRLYFCTRLKKEKTLPNQHSLQNLYTSQHKKIQAALDKLHEDLQYDYRKEISKIF